MSFVMVDVEAGGSIPGDCSMISFGPVSVTPALDKTFYRQLPPIRRSGVRGRLRWRGSSLRFWS